jgi:hypothetical protein
VKYPVFLTSKRHNKEKKHKKKSIPDHKPKATLGKGVPHFINRAWLGCARFAKRLGLNMGCIGA